MAGLLTRGCTKGRKCIWTEFLLILHLIWWPLTTKKFTCTIFLPNLFSEHTNPQTVWFEFREPTTIGKFSFRNRREPKFTDNNPTKFDFVGSTCLLPHHPNGTRREPTWETIKSVDNVIWNHQDEEKIWFIEHQNQKSFKCFGIRVLAITPGGTFAALQDLKMWKGES